MYNYEERKGKAIILALSFLFISFGNHQLAEHLAIEDK
jgi:hypothetical protein